MSARGVAPSSLVIMMHRLADSTWQQCSVAVIVRTWRRGMKACMNRAVGLHFVADSDITSLSRFSLDRAGRSILIILRHCGRIREVRGGGLTRYCVY